MPAVTLDLWHTLMFLPPEDEEAYMTHQLAIGQEVLRSAPRLPGAPELSNGDLGRAFERAYEGAVAQGVGGRTVTPAEQLVRAAKETGRDADPREDPSRLRTLVESTPFRVAPGGLDLLGELRGLGYRLRHDLEHYRGARRVPAPHPREDGVRSVRGELRLQ